MLTIIALHRQPIDSKQTWMTTEAYEKARTIPISKGGAGLCELFLLIGAIALIILSHQSFPPDFWLKHPATLIVSSAVCGCIALDACIALVVVLKGRAQTSQEKVEPKSTYSQWEELCVQTTAKQDPDFENIYKPFCQALTNQGVDASDYQLVVFRQAARYRPGLFSSDGSAPEFVLKDAPDQDPLNLKNYDPSKVLIVSYYSNDPKYERYVIEEPLRGGMNSTEKDNYLNNQFAYVHLNRNDLEILQKDQILSDQAMTVLRKQKL